MTTKVLITGITGQDGYYLANLLHDAGDYEIFGLVRGQNNPKLNRLKEELPFVVPVFGDLCDEFSLDRAINLSRPQYVFNLGAITYIPFSWEQPHVTYDVNFLGVQRLMDALVRYGNCKAFIQASTSEMFGSVFPGGGQAITEDTPLRPASPYAIAKTAAHYLVVAYDRAGKLPAVSAIMFNHESPRRGESFVTRKITLALARIAAGKQETLELGNAGATRDWGYAPEYMDALWRLATCKAWGTLHHREYIIATGEPATVAQFAFHTANLAGVGHDKIRFGSGADMRPNDVGWLRGQSERISDIGWSAKVRWRQLASLMLEHDTALVTR